jgi:hypothetical protein
VAREANLTEAQFAELMRSKGAPVAQEPKKSSKRAMNSWEREWADALEVRRLAGEVIWWGYEKVKLKLGDGVYYVPDFMVAMQNGGIQFHEIKGHSRALGIAKFKIAASLFPFAEFFMFRKDAKGWITMRRLNGDA